MFEEQEKDLREEMSRTLASKHDILELRREIAGIKADLVKTLVGWLLMAGIAQTTIVLGEVYFLLTAFLRH